MIFLSTRCLGQMDLERIRIELSLVDGKKCEQGALEILNKLRPKWRKEQVQFEIFTVGITNKIFAAYVLGEEEDKVIFRVFGKNTEKIIDREHELESWAVLAEKGLAAPLIGLFTNGIVCGFLPGKNLNVDLVREPKMQSKIAESMARMHEISMEKQKNACVFAKLRNFIKNISPTFENAKKQADFAEYFGEIDLEKEAQEMEKIVEKLSPEIGFCHNDLLVYNILFDEKSDRLNFIDYEYADFNYTSFDIGNHFCEWGGVDDVDYTRCPSVDERREWLREYLKAKNGRQPTAEELEEQVKQSDFFMALSHHFWTVWAIVQAQNSTIDFDYLGYAILRHKTYKEYLLRYLAK